MNDLEYRSLNSSSIVSLENDEMLVAGYAIVFDSPTLLFEDEYGNKYYEVITKDALVNCNLSDVVLRYNHNKDATLLARTSNDTLKLAIDDIGLHFEAVLANTQAGRDIYELIKRGDLSKMSFGFSVNNEKFEGNTRYITSLNKVFELSIVDFPAYNNTCIEAIYRSFEDIKQAEIEEAKTQHLRKQVELLTH